MENENIEAILKQYVPTYADKIGDYYSKESLKMGPPSDHYLKKMKQLTKRAHWKERFHIPVKTGQRIAAAVLIFFMAGTVLTFSVDAIRAKVISWIKTIYTDETLYQYKVEEETGHFIPMSPHYMPDGFQLVDKMEDEFTLMEVYENQESGNSITISEYWILDGDRIYENNEFISERKVKINNSEAILAYTEDGIMLRWNDMGCRIGVDSNTTDEEELIRICESIKIK